MKILMCCENYPPSIGGVQEVIRQIAERLVGFADEVTVVTSAHEKRSDDTVLNGVRVVSFPIRGNSVRGYSGPVQKYKDFIASGGYDAILIKAAQQWSFDLAVDVLPNGCRKVFIPCGFSGLESKAYSAYYKEMPRWLARFDELIFYSENYKDIDFARKHGFVNFHIVPNGVDEREFFTGSISCEAADTIGSPDQDVLLSVGSLIAAKGHWEVVRAFGLASLSRPALLVINGNAPGGGVLSDVKRMLKNLIYGRLPISFEAFLLNAIWKMLAVDKSIKIVDLKRSDLISLYKRANLFVFVSHVEYSPLVVFEAAAAGTAFILSSAGNCREIAQWTSGGCVLPPSGRDGAKVSISQLKDALEKILLDRSMLIEQGMEARRSVEARGLTWNLIAAQYRRILLGSSGQ